MVVIHEVIIWTIIVVALAALFGGWTLLCVWFGQRMEYCRFTQTPPSLPNIDADEMFEALKDNPQALDDLLPDSDEPVAAAHWRL